MGPPEPVHPRLSGGPCGPHPPLPTASAVVWALQEPLDRRLIGCDYSDVAVLGKAARPRLACARVRARGTGGHYERGLPRLGSSVGRRADRGIPARPARARASFSGQRGRYVDRVIVRDKDPAEEEVPTVIFPEQDVEPA